MLKYALFQTLIFQYGFFKQLEKKNKQQENFKC